MRTTKTRSRSICSAATIALNSLTAFAACCDSLLNGWDFPNVGSKAYITRHTMERGKPQRIRSGKIAKRDPTTEGSVACGSATRATERERCLLLSWI
jgi:hypothetical protein